MRRALLVAPITVALIASSALFAPVQAAPPVLPNEFGLHVPGIANGETPQSKYGTVRLWDSGVAWGQVEQRKGRYWWNGHGHPGADFRRSRWVRMGGVCVAKPSERECRGNQTRLCARRG
jgi:hypothetical protein